MLSWLRRPTASDDPAPGQAAAAADDDRTGDQVRDAERAVASGDLGRARRSYGEAIDACIAAGELERATALCRRLLEVDPAIVRVHCTLAFLGIALRDHAGIEASLDDYVRAATLRGARAFAAPSIQLMGRATADPRVKRCLADALDRLGDGAAAERMRRHADSGTALQKLIDAGGMERWRGLLQSATLAGLRERGAPPRETPATPGEGGRAATVLPDPAG